MTVTRFCLFLSFVCCTSPHIKFRAFSLSSSGFMRSATPMSSHSSASSRSSSCVRSNSTTPSTPLSEFQPTFFLLAPSLIDGPHLKSFVSTLAKGSDSKILLSIQHKPNIPDARALLQPLLISLRDAILAVQTGCTRFVTVPTGNLFQIPCYALLITRLPRNL